MLNASFFCPRAIAVRGRSTVSAATKSLPSLALYIGKVREASQLYLTSLTTPSRVIGP